MVSARPRSSRLGDRLDPDHPDGIPASAEGAVVVAWYVDADDWRDRAGR